MYVTDAASGRQSSSPSTRTPAGSTAITGRAAIAQATTSGTHSHRYSHAGQRASVDQRGRTPDTTPALGTSVERSCKSEQRDQVSPVNRVGTRRGHQERNRASDQQQYRDGAEVAQGVGGQHRPAARSSQANVSDRSAPGGNTGAKVAMSLPGGKNPAANPLEGIGGVRIDWLNVTFDSSKIDEVKEYLTVFEGTFVTQQGGMHGYNHCEATSAGVRLAWSDGRKDALLSMPGRSLTFAGEPIKLRGVINFLDSIGARSSRLDIAFDETDGLIDMPTVVAAAHAGQFTAFKNYTVQQGSDGTTVYFGRRGSNGGSRVVCMYDKAAEQRVEGIHWTRLEARFQSYGADITFRDLARRIAEHCTQDELHAAMCRWVSGSIDFREAATETDRHLSRRPRLDWWQRVVDRLGEPQRVSTPPHESHVEKMAAWLDRSLAPSLGFLRVVIDGMGDDFAHVIAEILDRNESRIRWDLTDARLQGVTRERLLAALQLPADWKSNE